MSIGNTVRSMILENPSMKNEDVLTAIKAKFPEAKTTYACIAWYKTDMRKKGLITGRNVKTQEQVREEIEQLKARITTLEAQLVTETEEV
jgi:hypothetical protein